MVSVIVLDGLHSKWFCNMSGPTKRQTSQRWGPSKNCLWCPVPSLCEVLDCLFEVFGLDRCDKSHNTRETGPPISVFSSELDSIKHETVGTRGTNHSPIRLECRVALGFGLLGLV